MLLNGGLTEKELIDRIINGDPKAFERLFHLYYPGLVVYSAQFTADRAEAEEIVQDFFVRLWNNRSKILPTESLKNYLFTSIKNSCINFLKHKKVEQKHIHKLLELSEHHLAYDPDLYLHSELQERIMNTFELLPGRCREIFIRSRLQGMKNEEIASELHLSKRTVETQISNALKIFRINLKEYANLFFLILP